MMASSSWFQPHYFDAYEQHRNSTQLLLDRQYGHLSSLYVRRRLQTHSIDRLEQEAILTGHEGCVNCLEWSSDGQILASGSDDFQVILWDPFRKRRIFELQTKHMGNMFSVKFLPRHNNSWIATGAADKRIYVFDISRSSQAIFDCECHKARVKRLATAPDSPYIFWSAGEDGTILQLDLRENHVCNSSTDGVRFIDLATYSDLNVEAKCLAINPRRTEQLAVGANDPYARIYDRRMLRPVSAFTDSTMTAMSSTPIPRDCVTYYCPGHISKNNSKTIGHESRAITYLTFNSAGTELLVNMGSEHVYLYDLQSAEEPIYLNLPEYKIEADYDMLTAQSVTESSSPTTNIIPDNCGENIVAANVTTNRRKIPDHIEHYKKIGNDYLENEKYLNAIEQYSAAITLAPDCAVLYLNRATAYMRRLWYGDVYAALRDCHQALRLDPSYIKAHFRLARSLLELGRPREAGECLQELKNRFPHYANNHGVLMLNKDIKENLQAAQMYQYANEGYSNIKLSDEEFWWRCIAKDYTKRFVGHCNTTTDIKEANYFGYDGEYIVAGSDDGNFFLWDRRSGKIRAVYKADGAIVNCVQPHPDICLMATSGIDHDIKLWAPVAKSPEDRPNLVSYIDKTVEDNQQKMKTDPFDLSTRNAFCWNG